MLLLTILVVATAIGVAMLVYKPLAQRIRENATHLTTLTARTRENLMLQMLRMQRERAGAFIHRAETACAKSGNPDRGCLLNELNGFVETNNIGAAQLAFRSLPKINTGKRLDLLTEESAPDSGLLASFEFDEHWRPYYIVEAQSPGTQMTVLTLYYELDGLEQIFSNPRELGQNGEVLLVGPGAYFFTRPRHQVDLRPEELIEVSQGVRTCLRERQSGEITALNYAGTPVLQAYRYIEEIGGGCIIASIPVVDAFAALNTIARRVLLGVVGFAGIALMFAFLIFHRVSRPIRTLSLRAKALEQGELDRRIPVEGPREIKTFARAFASMAHEIRRMIRSREDLVAIASHDLRNPLNSIQIRTDLIRQILDKRLVPDESDQKVRSAAIAIGASATQMSHLIDSLLSLARAQAGVTGISRTDVDVSDLIRASIENLRPIAEKKEVSINCNTKPCRARLDPNGMHQALSNLLGNAIKFCPAGTGRVAVELESCAPELRISVSDNGPGIAKDDLPRLFERFWQAERGRGTGLGLYISKSIVEAHGGQVRARSEIGKGSTFIITVPTVVQTQAKAA